MRDLHSTIQEFAARLRSEFAFEIERDARGFKFRVLRFLKAALPLRPGRPRNQDVTDAAEMHAQGKQWQQIYARCIPASVTGDSRQIVESRLRCAVRSRVRTNRKLLKHRKPVSDSTANKS